MPVSRKLHHAKSSVWKRIGRPDTPSGTSFILRQTKPSASNTGAGTIRPYPTTQLNAGDAVPGGTWSGQTLTITQDLKDVIVNGVVKVGAPGLWVENCVIRTDATTAPASGGTFLVHTNAATAVNPAIVRYNTMRPRTVSPLWNGMGHRNMTVEYNDISGVTDCFVPAPSGSMDVAMIIRGNYLHDMAFYAPDSSHSPMSSNLTPGYGSSTGKTFSGPWATVGWNHADIVQVEVDGTTGVTVIGNTMLARWTDDPTVSILPLPVDQFGVVTYGQLSCFMLNAGVDLVVEDNWMDYGQYCVNNGSTSVTGSFKRNKFGRGMAARGTAASDYYALMLSSPGVLTYDGTADQNVFEDTLTVVPRRGS